MSSVIGKQRGGEKWLDWLLVPEISTVLSSLVWQHLLWAQRKQMKGQPVPDQRLEMELIRELGEDSGHEHTCSPEHKVMSHAPFSGTTVLLSSQGECGT